MRRERRMGDLQRVDGLQDTLRACGGGTRGPLCSLAPGHGGQNRSQHWRRGDDNCTEAAPDREFSSPPAPFASVPPLTRGREARHAREVRDLKEAGPSRRLRHDALEVSESTVDGVVVNRPLGHLHDEEGPVVRVDTDPFELSNRRGILFVAAMKRPSLAKGAVRVRSQSCRELRHPVAIYPPRHDPMVP
jgi:hypothetical protein